MLASKRNLIIGLLAILAILVFIVLCIFLKDKAESWFFGSLTESGPLSRSEALITVPLPIFYPDQKLAAQYTSLDVTYYFFDYGAEQILEAYFISTKTEERERIALMRTYHNLYPSITISKNEQVPIAWADRGIAQSCKTSSFVYDKEFISGDLYQSCLTWLADGNHYIFYSIWPEDKAVDFVNSLVEVSR